MDASSRKIEFKSFSFPFENFIAHTSLSEGSKLHTYRYPANHQSADKKPPKAIIIFFHGFGSYVNKYAYLAAAYSGAGYEFVGYDYLGFGKSEGHRGFFESEEQLLGDGLSFIEKIKEFSEKEFGKQLPLIGMGISLGGVITVGLNKKYFEKHGKLLFDSLALIVPALVTADSVPEAMRQQVTEVAKAEPKKLIMPFAPPDEEFLKEFLDDELYYKGGVLAGTLNVIQQASLANFDFAFKLACPMHVSMGLKDALVKPEGIKAFLAQCPAPPKVVKEYEEGEHFLIMDAQFKDDVVANEIQFMDELYSQ